MPMGKRGIIACMSARWTKAKQSGQTNEEIRSGLIAVGFAQLATAAVSRTGGDVNFERPQGGDKGLL